MILGGGDLLPEESELRITKILAKIQQDVNEIKNIMNLLFRSDWKTKEELQRALDNIDKRIVYKLTDGSHTAHSIANKVNVSISTIHRWWREWSRVGLITERKGKKGINRKKVFTLEDLGIEPPEISSLKDKKQVSIGIPDRQRLRSILEDPNLFTDTADLVSFAERALGSRFKFTDKEDLIDDIINEFYNSSKRKQLIFVQALKEQARNRESSFTAYFESWEKHIKGGL